MPSKGIFTLGVGHVRRKTIEPGEKADHERLFRENFEKLGELGVAISVWQNGKAIIAQLGESGASGRAARAILDQIG